ncbi:MAG: hypothetical protein LRY62_03365 [Alphaproteobacteria bacterium]|nr:hypothetical protein [Alphaproteobacteria bacterium]
MSQAKPSFLTKLLAPISGTDRLEAENARLEAFLAAFPGHYCGFARDGSVAYSQGFCDCLGLPRIQSFSDIQNALSPGDGVAFESFWGRLKQDGVPFTLYGADKTENKHLKISGARGVDQSGGNAFLVMWVEDVTSQITAQEDYIEEQNSETEQPAQTTSALETLPWPAWQRDSDQKIIWVNEAYAYKLASTPETIIAEQKEFAAAPVKNRAAKTISETISCRAPISPMPRWIRKQHKPAKHM